MKFLQKILTVGGAGLVLLVQAAQAQTLVNTWSYAGGGLDPATYDGNYNPATLEPDAAFSNGASISVSGMTSGGLGSDGAGDYGGIYTFFSENPSFTMTAGTILLDLDEITISFSTSDGSPAIAYDESSLTLNYNLANSSVVSAGYSAISGITVPSPLGPQDLTRHTWTWTNLSALGTTTGFSTSFAGTSHQFFDEFSITQAIPEPTALGFLALGGALLALRRQRKSSPSS